MSAAVVSSSGEPIFELGRPVAIRELTYLVEGDEVTVGCRETDSYCVLPVDGAELLRRLADGMVPAEAAHWYAETYGEPVDVADFLAAMAELGFLADSTEPTADRPVRWQRLGEILFSRGGAVVCVAVVVAAVVSMLRHPDLVPSYRDLFFSHYLTVITLGVYLGQFPLLLLHEASHALAGRRLGLPSRLRVSYRLYFLVFETSLDGLVSVPRRKRFLPILAGVLCDLVVLALLTLVAALLRHPDGAEPFAGRFCLAMAFSTLLRMTWQFYFYLRTDLYYLAITVFGCQDLHGTARAMLANKANTLLRRRDRLVDESEFRPADRAVAHWYRWLILAGYVFSLGTLALAGIPAMIRMVEIVVGSLSAGAHWSDIADVVTVFTLTFAQFLVVFAVALRQRRATATSSH